MKPLEIILPTIILMLAILMKLLVNRSASIPLVVEAFFTLPVEMLFLALTFVSADAIENEKHTNTALATALALVAVGVIIVAIWRWGLSRLDKSKMFLSWALFVMNITISLAILIYVIRLITGEVKPWI
jgi:hypothetical protein